MMLSSRQILVIEDEQLTLRSLERVLRSEGAVVTCARSIEEAHAVMRQRDFDAGVVDLWLNGTRASVLIGALARAPRPTSSLLITGASDEDALAAGADEVLLKPFEAADFVHAVLAAVERTRKQRAGVERPPEPEEEEQGVPKPMRKKLIGQKPKTLGLLDLGEVARELSRLGELTPRESQVLVCMLRGLPNQEIGAELALPERTVKFHASNVFEKLGVTGRNDLPSLLFKR